MSEAHWSLGHSGSDFDFSFFFTCTRPWEGPCTGFLLNILATGNSEGSGSAACDYFLLSFLDITAYHRRWT
jgi:hypothetical protein